MIKIEPTHPRGCAVHQCIAALVCLASWSAYGQPGPGPSATAGARAAIRLPGDDGIPAPKGRPEEDGLPDLIKPPKLSPHAPQPAADSRNFEGVWFHSDMYQSRIVRSIQGRRLPYRDEARQILKYRREMDNAGSPLVNASAKCYPAFNWALEINAPFHIVQTDQVIYFVFQEFHDIWKVRMNQPRPPSVPRAYNGDSVGHWDGNTLVIETTHFKEPLWLDSAGTPASKDARLTHRIRKLEDRHELEIITTVDDPQMYAKPWSFARSFGWAPNLWMLGEYNCEQQVGGEAGVASYGVVEEKRTP